MLDLFSTVDLQLFAEGGADGGTGTADSGVADPSGVNPEKEEQVAAVESPEDRKSKFEAMIKGEYKDLYDERVSDTVTKRLKASKEITDKYEKLSPMLEMLGRKYGVDYNDSEALNKAIEEDDSYYEDEALEKGISVEQLKAVKKLERENAELKRASEQKAIQEQAEKDLRMWMAQAEEAKQTYPNLDLREELKNGNFVSMLRSGVDVGTAYFALHSKELVPQAMQYTAKAVEQKIANKVMANGMRPTENGNNSQSASSIHTDVAHMSREQRAELIKRASMGEKIKL